MLIFQYEWKRWRKYILIWALTLALAIFFMTPLYYQMLSGAAGLPANFAQGGFFAAVGVSLELLREPLGMYSFLTGFFMIAGGVFGMHLGISLHSRECTENTAEYLYSKPCGRRRIYLGKTLCALTGAGLVGAAYLLASFLALRLLGTAFPWQEFLLLALSFFLLALFFSVGGLLVGVCWPNNRSPLLTAVLTVFLAYCVTSFSRTIGVRTVGFLSPFSFFSPLTLHETGFYQGDYLLWYLILLVFGLHLAYRKILKQDVLLAV